MLRFRPDGTFRILQVSDVHSGPSLDPRTEAGLRGLIATQAPDLILLVGDLVLPCDCASKQEVQEGVAQLGALLESCGIPWAMTFGNHEMDDMEKHGITKPEFFAMYREFAHNVNPPSEPELDGEGNGRLDILGSQSDKPEFGIWLLDSHAYTPDSIAGQKMEGYGWIRPNQVHWYYETSKQIEAKRGSKLPSLMFFHICLPEFGELAKRGPIEGERNENECPGALNSGLFATLLERGDVCGVYVGHDHVNTYEGNYLGIRLGFDGSIGYTTYGLNSEDEAEKHRLRGGRVFELKESNPRDYWSRCVSVVDPK